MSALLPLPSVAALEPRQRRPTGMPLLPGDPVARRELVSIRGPAAAATIVALGYAAAYAHAGIVTSFYDLVETGDVGQSARSISTFHGLDLTRLQILRDPFCLDHPRGADRLLSPYASPRPGLVIVNNLQAALTAPTEHKAGHDPLQTAWTLLTVQEQLPASIVVLDDSGSSILQEVADVVFRVELRGPGITLVTEKSRQNPTPSRVAFRIVRDGKGHPVPILADFNS